MTDFPEGAPCWVDAMFVDLEGAKRFYADVLGWTFGESASEFGDYAQAFSDGEAVAGVVPPMPGEEGKSAWNLYFATPDAAATAEKVKAAGGELLMESMQVGRLGTMALAKEPTGAAFGLWQPDQHKGFAKVGEPGAFCWAEFFTREPDVTDAFLTKAFTYSAQQMTDAGVDFKVFKVGGSPNPVLGRMTMGDEFPPEVPAYVNVYFAVGDCDAAVQKAVDLGATLRFGPMDSPYGRFAAVTDPQGANFSVIDTARTVGEMPAPAEA
ncbi:VOC family protein [Streptomyces sp. NPDC088197]|uniref:VOC family protein n=1 Tax=Streptomyces sp. NPDC088197 TaxID=3365840 RepID=UPI003801991A